MRNFYCMMAVICLIPALSGCTTYVQASAHPEIVGVAPYPGAVWVPGHYGPYGGWHPGHWRSAY